MTTGQVRLTLHLHLRPVRDLYPRIVLANSLHELREVPAAVHDEAAVDLLPIFKAHRRPFRRVFHLYTAVNVNVALLVL